MKVLLSPKSASSPPKTSLLLTFMRAFIFFPFLALKFYVEHQFCELILWQWRRANTFEFLMPTSELSTKKKKANLLSAISDMVCEM